MMVRCEEAFDAWSETWSDTAVWHGPAFWEVWQAAWSAAYAEGQREMRERAAKTCDDMDHNGVMVAEECANAIRNLEIEE